ncbi:Acylcarnitine hydrolase [Fusarium oxysporum f. sp. albedinis]|nr:Acylcarnitine hydrolase [Fusarium oxysporum f. sp. albedinis]
MTLIHRLPASGKFACLVKLIARLAVNSFSTIKRMFPYFKANNHHMHLVNCSVSSGPPHETLVQSIYIQPTTNNQRLEPTTSTIKFFNPSKSRNCRSKQRKRESLGKRATSDSRALPNIKRPF